MRPRLAGARDRQGGFENIMRIRLFTLCWGEKYRRWLRNGCARSLSWPLNQHTLKGLQATWDIYTNSEDAEDIRDIAQRLAIESRIYVRRDEAEQVHGTVIQQRSLVDQMIRCLEQNAMCLIASPDFIFGDGTLGTLVSLGKWPRMCVAPPSVRINAAALDDPAFGEPMTTDELCAFSWKHLHATWADANCEAPMNNCIRGGVGWRRLPNSNMVAATHHMPPAILLNFDPSDVVFFKDAEQPGGVIDHHFPRKLIAEKRLRVIGSSDVAFVADVTDPNENVPELLPRNNDMPDGYFSDFTRRQCDEGNRAAYTTVTILRV